jgi:hypothetical protein
MHAAGGGPSSRSARRNAERNWAVRTYTRVDMRRSGWLWFWLWAIPGVALGLQVSVIGVLFLPVALVVAIVLGKVSRPWPEALGILAGIGLTFLLIALLNSDSWPWTCPASGEIVTRTANSVTVESCDRWYAAPWLVSGLLFTFGAAVCYRLIARRRHPSGGEAPAVG